MTSRRQFLGGALAVLGTRGGVVGAESTGAPAVTRGGDDALESALERLANTGPEFGGGLANHGPMAAEALVRLGRPEAVTSWVEEYRHRLQSHPESRKPIAPDAWSDALGDFDRVGDWVRLFERQLREGPWVAVLAVWAPRLAPGLVGAAFHGLIRTGHAVRALGRRDTPPRRQELAEGLAYWAARYRRLPEAAHPRGSRLPSEALPDVALLPAEQRTRRRLITEGLAGLDAFPAFGGVIDLVDSSRDASAFLSNLTATFARVYLDQAVAGGSVITFIHTVTGPSAIRLLLPHLPADTHPALLRYGWQGTAGVYAALGQPSSGALPAEAPKGADALVDRAVASGDEHAIKFTEACLREHAVDPRPVYLEAAADAVRRLGRG